MDAFFALADFLGACVNSLVPTHLLTEFAYLFSEFLAHILKQLVPTIEAIMLRILNFAQGRIGMSFEFHESTETLPLLRWDPVAIFSENAARFDPLIASQQLHTRELRMVMDDLIFTEVLIVHQGQSLDAVPIPDRDLATNVTAHPVSQIFQFAFGSE
ncbi:MAG: hypothetical protein OXF83_08840, partial [Anaerolineaceae bacterium]|nr:hypothetical protein [Anaerolineaceae bacterium]